MAQTGFTPLLIYSSSTATNAPTAGNLLNNATGSELAINITDGKLFYKDSSNAVQVIGWKIRPATAGGTGLTSFAVGDLIYADTTTTLAKLADVAIGNALISSGVGVAPSYGKIGLTTHVSGTLPVANGGTGLTSLTAGYIPYGNGTGAFSSSANMTFDGSTLTTLNSAYTGTLTGGTGIVNLGSGQFYKDASGNVGIGTSTINAKFQLQVGDVMPSASGNMATGVVIQAGSGSQALNIGTTVTNSYVWLNSAYANNSNSATPMVFMTGATERMRIDSSGNLLVGTTTQASTAKISIAGSVGATAGYLCHAGISAGNVFGNVFNFFWTSSSLQAWIDSTNVGNVTLVSDYRIKKDIVTQDAPAIARINQLRPVTYERTDYKNLYKADGVAREGFIAHELQEIIPSAVEGEKDAENQIQSLSLDALCSVMVKAIQEQQALITDLQARLTKAGL